MSKAAAFRPAEEEAIIRSRYLAQASVPRGEPPFKKVAKRFMELCLQAEKGSGEDADKSLNDLMREIAAVEMQGLKMKAVCDSNSFEQKRYQEKQEALQAEIAQAHADIEQKKEELEEASQHPSRSSSGKGIDRVQLQIASIGTEGAKYEAMLQKRRKQFALLLHVIKELQLTADDQGDKLIRWRWIHSDLGFASVARSVVGPSVVGRRPHKQTDNGVTPLGPQQSKLSLDPLDPPDPPNLPDLAGPLNAAASLLPREKP
eukprot:gene23578-9105_t